MGIKLPIIMPIDVGFMRHKGGQIWQASLASPDIGVTHGHGEMIFA
jgi:hypothetical protein